MRGRPHAVRKEINTQEALFLQLRDLANADTYSLLASTAMESCMDDKQHRNQKQHIHIQNMTLSPYLTLHFRRRFSLSSRTITRMQLAITSRKHIHRRFSPRWTAVRRATRRRFPRRMITFVSFIHGRLERLQKQQEESSSQQCSTSITFRSCWYCFVTIGGFVSRVAYRKCHTKLTHRR